MRAHTVEDMLVISTRLYDFREINDATTVRRLVSRRIASHRIAEPNLLLHYARRAFATFAHV